MNENDDGYDERLNPYYGTCAKHGSWHGSYDECPECMKREYVLDEVNIPNSICWNCYYGDEPSITVKCSFNPKLKHLCQIPRKKKCKHYCPIKNYDSYGEL